MAPSPLQAPTQFDSGFASGGTAAKSYSSALTSGSKLIAFASISANTSVTFSDSAGNTWTTAATFYHGNIGYTLAIGWADNTSTASGVTVTATYGVSGVLRTLGISEFSDLAAGAVDVFTAGTHVPAGSLTPADALMTTTDADLVITVASNDGSTMTAGSGFTLLGYTASSSTGWEYQVQGAAGSITPTITQATTVQADLVSAAFKPSAGGDGPAVDLVAAHWLLRPPGRLSPAGRFNAWRGTEDLATGTAYTQTADEDTGLTDDVALDRGLVATDSTGLTDTLVFELGKVITDSTGLTDSVVLARTIAVDDNIGLTDTATTSFVKEQTFTDDTGLTDSVTVSRGYGIAQTDTTGLTDAVTIDRSLAVTDTTGLTDTVVTSLGIARTVDDTTGLTDSVSIDNGKVVNQNDTVGLTDALTIARGQSATDTVGLTDSVSLSLSRPVTDSAGLTDSVTVENGKTVAATDTAGLTDSVVLQLFKAITDNTGLSDLAALTRGLVLGENTGLTDSIVVDLFDLTALPPVLTVGAPLSGRYAAGAPAPGLTAGIPGSSRYTVGDPT